MFPDAEEGDVEIRILNYDEGSGDRGLIDIGIPEQEEDEGNAIIGIEGFEESTTDGGRPNSLNEHFPDEPSNEIKRNSSNYT